MLPLNYSALKKNSLDFIFELIIRICAGVYNVQDPYED